MSRLPGMYVEHVAIRRLRRDARLISSGRLTLAPRHMQRARKELADAVART